MGKVVKLNIREVTLRNFESRKLHSKILQRRMKPTIRNKPKRKGRVYND